MSVKAILISTSFALLASTALAQSSKEDIIEQLKQQGFTKIEISRTLFGNTRFEATGAGVEREVVLSKGGTVMRDRSEKDDEYDDSNNDDDDGDQGGDSEGDSDSGNNDSDGGDNDSDGDSEGDSDGGDNDSDGGDNDSDGDSEGDDD